MLGMRREAEEIVHFPCNGIFKSTYPIEQDASLLTRLALYDRIFGGAGRRSRSLVHRRTKTIWSSCRGNAKVGFRVLGQPLEVTVVGTASAMAHERAWNAKTIACLVLAALLATGMGLTSLLLPSA